MALVLLLLAAAHAAQVKTKPPQQQAEAKARYESLVAKLKTGDTNIDYQALRYSRADSPEFVSGGDRDKRQKMWAAMREKNGELALSLANKMLEDDYTDMTAHLACRTVYEVQGNAEKSKYHTEVARGLARSILDSGDGKSAKSAMTVISIPEQHMIMQFLELKPKSQALAQEDGHAYDIWDAEDRSGQTVKLYFNIDKFFGRY